jgi:hypothetical protein
VGNSDHLKYYESDPQVKEYFTESLCFPFSKVENLIDTPLQDTSAINISKENKAVIEDPNITNQLKEDEIKLKVKENSNNTDNENHILTLNNKKEEEDFCKICLGSLTNTIYLLCSHKFCSTCLINYITSKINIKDVDRIVCPQYNCNRLFSHKDIVMILSEYEKYKKEVCRLYLKKLKEKELIQSSVYLKCPFPDCDSYSSEQGWKNSKFKTCMENHKFCFICNKSQESHLKESEDCVNYTKGIDIGNSEVCHFCGFIQLKSDQNIFMECDSCRIIYCLLCKRYSTNTYNHYRAFTPCFKLKNCKKNSILAKSFFFRCFRLFIIIIVFIMMIPLLVLFGSTIFFIIFNRKYFNKLFEEDPWKIKLSLIVVYSFTLGIIFYFLISLILLSIGSLYLAGEFIPMVLRDYLDYFSNTKQSIKKKWNINLIVNERDGSNTIQKIDKLLIKYFQK